MTASAALFSTLRADVAPEWLGLVLTIGAALAVLFVLGLVIVWLTVRYIPHNQVGIVEKLWSQLGSVPEGCIIALNGEAGYQASLLRGGLHFGLWRWQYRIHKVRLLTIPQGKIGYIYARDGDPLPPNQTLGRVVECNYFQDARAFLSADGSRPSAISDRPSAVGEQPSVENSESLADSRRPIADRRSGQRGRQRAILREGVYAINPALFVIITEEAVYALRHLQGHQEREAISHWQKELRENGGFKPVIIGTPVQAPDPIHPERTVNVDSIGIVTIHDGPSLAPGEIIAPAVGTDRADPNYHSNFQDPEAFLRAGGRRGRQYAPLTDGTYFINRWFATVEVTPKTVVPIGYVGVVVSYYGRVGRDVSGDAFRHGERVAEGERGVWERPLGPGKYAFNTYAGNIILVPTTNFVLHWITGKTETHRYDESLKSIDLVTKDAYEPMLPLSVVVHIDYQRAPSVIQRFGDVKKLITQTLDPMLSAYFRDIAHKKTMLELLQLRDSIQGEARDELRRKFREFDIECVDVLIGKPDTAEAGGKIETLLEQLRLRQLSIEQLETYERQRATAEKLRTLNEANAQANMQTQLTNSRVQVQISESQGDADLARARRQAEQSVVMADADLARARRQAEQLVLTAQAESQKLILAGRGEGQRIMQQGLSEAAVQLRKITSFGDPRLYALALVAEHLSRSSQPLVPERVFIAGANGEAGNGQASQGLLGTLIGLMVAEKSGFQPSGSEELATLKEYTDRMTRDTMEAMQEGSARPSLTGNGAKTR